LIGRGIDILVGENYPDPIEPDKPVPNKFNDLVPYDPEPNPTPNIDKTKYFPFEPLYPVPINPDEPFPVPNIKPDGS
jgi:hypothetical protein